MSQGDWPPLRRGATAVVASASELRLVLYQAGRLVIVKPVLACEEDDDDCVPALSYEVVEPVRRPPSGEALKLLSRLAPNEAKAWSLIAEYVSVTGRRCFTYDDIIRFWPGSRVRLHALTLDRALRRLADRGVLVREGEGRSVRLCVPQRIAQYMVGGGDGDSGER